LNFAADGVLKTSANLWGVYFETQFKMLTVLNVHKFCGKRLRNILNIIHFVKKKYKFWFFLLKYFKIAAPRSL